jgi:TonB-dependent receptor
MTKPHFRLTPIALAMLAIAPPAMAQQSGSPPGGPAPQRIEVTGFRSSLESALQDKREDNGIIDVIKAEDIAKFPDTNLAESLQRVPGVVIDRDAGEGRTITIRGLGPDFTRVVINGIEAQASTGGTDSSGGNNRSRGFDFNVFPSDLFSALVVRKSSAANIDEGSLGATVELRTARPFDYRGLKASASIQGRYNDLSEDTDPRGAFLVSNTFADRTFGVLVSGAFSKRNLYEEGFSTVRWDNGASSGGWCAPVGVTPANPTNSTATTCGPAAQGVPRLPASQEATDAYNTARSAGNFHPRLPRYGRLTHEQERTGLTASLQWKPTPVSLLTFDYLYSKIKATRQEDFLQAISFSRNAGQGGKPQTSVVETTYDANGALLYGVYNGVDIRSESRFDKLSTTFKQPTLSFEHAFSDTWKLTGKVGRSDSKFDNPVQTTTTLDALNVNGYVYDARGNDRLPLLAYPFDPSRANPLTIVGVPMVTSGTQPATIPNTTSSEIRIRPQGSTNTIDAADAEIAWEAIPHTLTLRGGPAYKKYEFDTFEFRRVNQNDTMFPIPTGTSIDALTTTISGFGRGLDLPPGSITSWIIPNLNAIADAYNIYCNCLQSGPVGGPGDYTLSSTTNGNARGNNRSVVEKDTGVFFMADFDTRFFGIPARGNIGVRYVKTEQSATGYQATAGGTEVTVENEYSDTLPSANLALTFHRDFIVRLAAAKVMARPQLGNLSPGGSIATTGNLTITVGNPLLKPFRAKTFDSSFEYYFGRNSFIGLGLFYKDIDTYIQSLRVNVPYNETGLPISLLPPNFTGTEVFQVTTPVNTPGGPLRGYEINYQQSLDFLGGAWRNFGGLFNYTHVKSKIDYLISPTGSATITDDLLNLSPKTWNATLYYDDGRFSARVTGTFRDTFVTRVPGQNNNDVEGKNSSTNVDASISYKVTPNIQVILEGVNLTNEVNDQFISRARNSPVVYSVSGREYMAGVRVSF